MTTEPPKRVRVKSLKEKVENALSLLEIMRNDYSDTLAGFNEAVVSLARVARECEAGEDRERTMDLAKAMFATRQAWIKAVRHEGEGQPETFEQLTDPEREHAEF